MTTHHHQPDYPSNIPHSPGPGPRTANRQPDDIDLAKYLFLFLENWYWFILMIFLGVGAAYFANKYTIRIYKVNATLLIEDEKGQGMSFGTGGGSGQQGADVLSGFGLVPSMKNLQNQTLILQSHSQIDTTVHKIDFQVSYFKKEMIGKREIYHEAPFIVKFDKSRVQPLGVTFTVTREKNEKFRITGDINNGSVPFYNYLTEKVTGSAGTFSLDTVVAFGEQVEGKNYLFTFLPDTLAQNDGGEGTYYFNFNSYEGLLGEWKERLTLTPMKTNASMVELSVNTDCPAKAMAFLDAHLQNYLKRTLDKKNLFAKNTIRFIDAQLLEIQKSLGETEITLQNYRKDNKVVNISFQSQQLFEQTKLMENSKAELRLKADYYTYLRGYLGAERKTGDIVAPSIMGIDDPMLNNLVVELNRLESDKIAMKGDDGSMNPYIRTIDSQIKNAMGAAGETVKNLEKNNNMAIKDIENRLSVLMTEVSRLPQTERELFNIERNFKLNDYIFSYLLQRRSEAQIAKASNAADNEIIDFSRVSGAPISPKVNLNYLLGLLLGFLIPGLFFMAKEALNIKVETEDEVRRITSLPVAGHIAHHSRDYQDVVLRDPNSTITESFRGLRTRMKFFTREIKNPVILITSSMPNEGKTFTALNLASAYSISGSKTVLVSFDLRRPRLYTEFGLTNEKGISTYLIGRDTIDEIIVESGYNNLWVVQAGPVPPNPSELSASPKTKELFEELKKRFDFIIVDSAPIGAVSDTYAITAVSDSIIMLVRHNKTIRQLMKDTMEDCKANGVTNISILMNDIRNDMRTYGYRGRYGYVYGYEYSYGSNSKH